MKKVQPLNNLEFGTLATEAAALDAELEVKPAENLTSNPEAEKEQAELVQSSRAAAALFMQGFSAVVTIAYPSVRIGAETQAQGAEKLAPVLAKHGFSNSFLDKWKEEIDFGMWFGGVLIGIYSAVEQQKAQKPADTPASTSPVKPADAEAPDLKMNAVTSSA